MGCGGTGASSALLFNAELVAQQVGKPADRIAECGGLRCGGLGHHASAAAAGSVGSVTGGWLGALSGVSASSAVKSPLCFGLLQRYAHVLERVAEDLGAQQRLEGDHAGEVPARPVGSDLEIVGIESCERTAELRAGAEVPMRMLDEIV